MLLGLILKDSSTYVYHIRFQQSGRSPIDESNFWEIANVGIDESSALWSKDRVRPSVPPSRFLLPSVVEGVKLEFQRAARALTQRGAKRRLGK